MLGLKALLMRCNGERSVPVFGSRAELRDGFRETTMTSRLEMHSKVTGNEQDGYRLTSE